MISLTRFEARLLELLPNLPLTVDRVALPETDNVVSAAAEREGRTPTGPLEGRNDVVRAIYGYCQGRYPGIGANTWLPIASFSPRCSLSAWRI